MFVLILEAVVEVDYVSEYPRVFVFAVDVLLFEGTDYVVVAGCDLQEDWKFVHQVDLVGIIQWSLIEFCSFPFQFWLVVIGDDSFADLAQWFGLVAWLVERVSVVGKEDDFGTYFDQFLHHLDKVLIFDGDSSRVAEEDGVRAEVLHGRVELISEDESDEVTLVALDMLVLLRNIVFWLDVI